MNAKTTTYVNACSHGLPDASCTDAISNQARRPPNRNDEEAQVRASARKSCATLLSADIDHVGLGVGTFQLWSAIMGRLPLNRGRILVAEHEWGDHVRWLQRLAAHTNITFDVISGDAVDPSSWAAHIDRDVIALCLQMVTSVAGLRYPVREISALPRPADALVVIDAAQAFGRVRVNPAEIGCDVIVGTTRKWLRGPRQTAMFWMSSKAKQVLNCDVRDIEPFDLNAALLAGLTRAANFACERTIPTIKDEVTWLDTKLRAGLEDASSVQLVPSLTPGTVLCKIPLDVREMCATRLDEYGVVAKWCDAKRDEPLSIDRVEAALLRFSPHLYNTEHDIAAVVEAVSIDSTQRCI